MKITAKVQHILDHYDYESPAVRKHLAQILMHGRLAGSGRLVILPVDQGFEHGPARSFAANPDAYDPLYHWNIAIQARLSAFAAPLGLLEAGAHKLASEVPTILKLNSSNTIGNVQDQSINASPEDALRLGAVAVGLTIYPGADTSLEMYEETREAIAEARSLGLASVVWSYPRGGALSKDGETALDSIAYGAHIAALLGAHIIKVKPPSEKIENPEAKKAYQGQNRKTLRARVAHIRQAAFNGRRIIVFSGGATTDDKQLLNQVREVHAGGGHGSIIGRNVFQRPQKESLELLNQVIAIYRSS
ncbi:MAG: class I fructose-bisphosphate aldolase [Alphaproteobacteria bacterium]